MKRHTTYIMLALIAVTTVGLLAAGSYAQSGKKGKKFNVNKDGFALLEHDPVLLKDDGKLMKGDRKFMVVHHGVKYAFSSADSMKIFQKTPSDYIPAYGGYCAMGISLGKFFDVELSTAAVVDGRLMLNKDKEIEKLFNENLDANVKKADANWPKLSGKK